MLRAQSAIVLKKSWARWMDTSRLVTGMPVLGEVDLRRKSLFSMLFSTEKEMCEWETKDKQVERATQRAK